MIQSPAGYQGDVRIKRYLDFYQAGYGVAMLSSGVAFSPLSLFANGEPGGWYDPSDLTTLYQDAAGTTPVTAVEQPVGLVLDKSKGLVLGPELISNGSFANGTTGWLAINSATIAASGGELTVTAGSGTGNTFGGASQTITTVIGQRYFIVASVKTASKRIATALAGAGGYPTTTSTSYVTLQFSFVASSTSSQIGVFFDNTAANGDTFTVRSVSVRELPGNHLSQSTTAARPVLSARVNALVNTATLSTQSVTTLATNYTLRFEGAGSIALSGTGSGTYSAGSHTVTCTAGTLTLTVTGSVTNADLRPANAGVGLPAYQRVGAATSGSSTAAGNADYDADPALWPRYLRFDGVDDALASASINFTSTDKMSVFAGVRKLSDAALGMVTELSVALGSNNGSFYLVAPSGGSGNDYSFVSKGTASAGAGSGASYVSPITNVVAGLGNISGDSTLLRINGVEVGTNSADQGTGNFGNYPLYVGSRAGSSLRFNGHLYSLIVRGAATDAATITSTETWVNQKTLAY